MRGTLVSPLAQPNVATTQQAVLTTLAVVSGSLQRTTELLARLEANPRGLLFKPTGFFGSTGLFSSFLEDAIQRRQWLGRTLAEVQRLAQTASQVEDPDMQLALLRLSGPRLEAVVCGAQLLAAWADFLHLVEAVLPWCPPYSLEHLLRQTASAHKRFTPAMTALASLEPEPLEDTALALPESLNGLTHDFDALREEVLLSPQRAEQVLKLKQILEGVTLGLAMGLTLPAVTPTAPGALGVGLAMGSEGVAMGLPAGASARGVESMSQLVRAGVISTPAIGAAVQIRAGQVLLSQSRDELPKGVREALGEGPEVRGMRQTGRAGAGMSESPRHHVLPREHREWFEQRGFTGEMDIDQFCVEMEQADHEAIHGGGDWRLGRQWPGEWNQRIMRALTKTEAKNGRMLTRAEILDIVAKNMNDSGIPMNFSPWRGR